LKTAAVLFGLAWLAKAAGAVKDALKRLEVDCFVFVSTCTATKGERRG